MDKIFCISKEKTAARYEYRARGLTQLLRKRHSNRLFINMLKTLIELQSFQRGISYFGQRRENIKVFTPLQFPLLAKSRNTGAQTIPFNDDRLWVSQSLTKSLNTSGDCNET